MVLECMEQNGVKIVRSSELNGNNYMNIIDIRIEMANRMKLYKSSQNELARTEIVKEFTILEKMLDLVK